MRVSLMITCLGDVLRPAVGLATVRLLRRLGVEVRFPQSQTCCGQPFYNSGYAEEARRLARRTIKAFDDGRPVVVPSGSCAAMVRLEYAHLFEENPAWRRRAEELAGRTYELAEFLVHQLKVEEVGAVWREGTQDVGAVSSPPSAPPHPDPPPREGRETISGHRREAISGPRPDSAQEARGPRSRLACHYACHLRGLGLIDEAERLVRRVRGVELVPMERQEQCCGFGGSFSVRYPEVSGAMVADKVNCIEQSGADAVVSTDTGCLLNIAGCLHRRGCKLQALHLAELLVGGPCEPA